MKNIVAFIFFALMAAVYLPEFVGKSKITNDSQPNATLTKARRSGPATVKTFSDSRGHFMFQAFMNGKRVKVLVDTGATAVAINQSTARKIGLRTHTKGLKVSTANGLADAAMGTIKVIQIGQLQVRNVKALVLSDQALSGTLLGMAFLKKLKKFEITGRTLTLTK